MGSVRAQHAAWKSPECHSERLCASHYSHPEPVLEQIGLQRDTEACMRLSFQEVQHQERLLKWQFMLECSLLHRRWFGGGFFFFHLIRKKEEWCKPAAEKASHSSVQKPEVMLLSARRQTRAVIEIYPGLFPFALPDGCYKTQRHEVYAWICHRWQNHACGSR